MNERIQELKYQAGVDRNPDQEGLDQFAQLIVRECIEICESGTATQTTSSGAAQQIQQHFGVKM